ncbi:MAG TPA: L,D-transpeptidase family protein [Mycobacteriales bacterium]|jgi:lipoprotein-anchoring transpeptidase ErfK/SrfK|nr:L,D-transpeptidase family protein [Mycobacteriales bacterium]
MGRRTRRGVTTLAVALLVLLTTAASVAVDRLRPPGDPLAASPIVGPYTMLPVPNGTVDLPFDPTVRPKVVAAPVARVGACPAAPAVSPLPATPARAVGTALAVRTAPDGPVARTLSNPTIEGQQLTVLVVERRGAWLRVQLPVRPNGSTGWVRAAEVAPYTAPFRIQVELCAKRLTVYRGGRAVWQRPVAVGAPRTPTPTGSFYVDFVTPMRYGGAYGPFLLSVAGFSNVLHQFGNGGIGQIGIHGTNRPSSIGTAASHGCVRLRNADLLQLVKLVPPGTPVTIVR